MLIKVLSIIGIFGGVLCAVADLFLDLKGADNKKLGNLSVIDSKWEQMPHYRFVTSTVLAMFAVPMYCCGMIALTSIIKINSPVFAKALNVIFLVGAMGGFFIHTFLNLCPTIYQIIIKEASFDLAERVITGIFRQVYVPFFTCYTMLVIIPAVMIVYAIFIGIIHVPLWTICLNPVFFQIVGLLFRATKIKCFIDAPSCCAASLGLASYGILALLAI